MPVASDHLQSETLLLKQAIDLIAGIASVDKPPLSCYSACIDTLEGSCAVRHTANGHDASPVDG